MSPAEVFGRVWYRCLTAVERRQRQRGTLPGPVLLNGRAPLGTGATPSDLLARRPSQALFLTGPSQRQEMRELFTGPFHREFRSTLDEAARAREQRFEFFGLEFRYPDAIDWQADPVTKRRWPSVYHADVPVHKGDVGYGDVKHVWELSRQQFLIDLAKAFFLAGDVDSLQAMQKLVRSWISGNPYGVGVNWACALEPAFRAWSWLWAYHLTVDALDDDFHAEWLRSFHDHGRFLHRHLEHYSSPYNHLIGEASALYALGVCFPEFSDAAKWRRRGRFVLERRLKDQFHPDGGSVEQSTFYHHATTGFYILAAVLGRNNGEEFSRDIWNAIEQAIGFSMHLMQPDGRTPAIGGADDGKPIRMEHLPFWDFRPYQAIGAVLFERGDFKAAAGRFYEDALWVLGPKGLDAFRRIVAVPPAATSIILPASGYAVSRSSWSADADYVCFDIGEQAAGMRPDAVPNSMHGHADCLSVIVALSGRPVLVDSGLYAYNCGGDWEDYYRETAAHNTAKVDGRDQALHIGKMAWSHSYRAAIEHSRIGEAEAWTVGSHDGYARGEEGVTHRRTVWRRPDGLVLIHDEFVGKGSHEIEINWQFAPGALTLTGSNTVSYDRYAELTWLGTARWTPLLRCGGATPADGWICTSLGVRRAAPKLTLRESFNAGRASLLTVISAGVSRATVNLEEGLVAVRAKGAVDWVAASGITAGTTIQTDARLAVCRVGAGGVVQSQVQGTHIRADHLALGRLSAPIALAGTV